MAVTADPLWINASSGAPAYSANELRQAMALALMYNGRTLGARQGVRPGGNALQASIAGSTITVRAGVACVDPGLTTAQGPYWVCLPADDTFTLTAAHATLPRKDVVFLRVYDHDEDSSGQRKAQVEYQAGTAAGSPSEPSVPAGAFRLATIDVPSVANGNPPAVTNNFPFAVANGGIIPVRDVTQRGLITPYDGMVIERMDRNPRWLELYDGTAWRVQGTAICSSAADRDGASGVTNPVTGQLVLLTDSNLLTRWSGSAWVYHGLYRSDQILGVDTASVPFTIPSTFRKIAVEWRARSTAAVVFQDIRMRINGDTATNYHQNFHNQVNATISPFAQASQQFATIGVIPAASAAANNFGAGEVEIPIWSSSVNLNWIMRSHYWESAGNSALCVGGGLYFASGPFTSITLLPEAGNFKAGSTFTLYGWE